MHRERRRVPTETLGADAGLIYRFEQLFLQRSHLWIRIFGAERTRRRFFCQCHA